MNIEATRYNMREQGVENGGEGDDTTQPTQLNHRQCEPLDGRMGSIHGSQ